MDVEQRMGPRGRPGTAVTPLEAVTVATRADAARVRRRFRAWVGELADPDIADDLTLAVYEALANVVDHAYHPAEADVDATEPGPMRLWAAASAPLPAGRALVVTVSDRGVWRRPRDPGWRGRGLPLVHSLTTASLLVSAGGTTVQMHRRVTLAPSDDDGAPGHREPGGSPAPLALAV